MEGSGCDCCIALTRARDDQTMVSSSIKVVRQISDAIDLSVTHPSTLLQTHGTLSLSAPLADFPQDMPLLGPRGVF
jgi:hypothetical protein